jgi:hypothetical protein
MIRRKPNPFMVPNQFRTQVVLGDKTPLGVLVPPLRTTVAWRSDAPLEKQKKGLGEWSHWRKHMKESAA